MDYVARQQPSLHLTVIDVFNSLGLPELSVSNSAQSYRHIPLQLARRTSATELRTRLRDALFQAEAELVYVPGWSFPLALLAIEWCLQTRCPYVVMSDSLGTSHGFRSKIKRRVLQLAGAALVAGTPHIEYLSSLGFPSEAAFTGYDAIDNDHFSSGAETVRSNAKQIRSALGLPDNYFLCCARLVPEKNLDALLIAYSEYVQSNAGPSPSWSLVLVGDGPLRDHLTTAVDALGLRQLVHFVGSQPYDKLPAYYGLAKALVLASKSETWGLVVNEALAAGLPVLVSRACGCVRDLVIEGANGFAFNPGDFGQLASLMRQLSAGSDQRLYEMGLSSSQLALSWGLERFNRGFASAGAFAVQRSTPDPTPLDYSVLRLLAARPGVSK